MDDFWWAAVVLLALGSFLLPVELLCSQLCARAFLLALGASLLAIGAFLLTIQVCLITAPQQEKLDCKPKAHIVGRKALVEANFEASKTRCFSGSLDNCLD